MVLAGLPLPDATHEVLATLNFSKRPRIRGGVIAILAVKVGCTVADQDDVLVLGLNGSVRVKNALGSKKASVHSWCRSERSNSLQQECHHNP